MGEEGEEAVPARNTASRRKRKETRTSGSTSSTGGFQRAVGGATQAVAVAASAAALVFLGTVPERGGDGKGERRGGKVPLLGSDDGL